MDEESRNSLWNLLCKYYFVFISKPKIFGQIYLSQLDKSVKLLFDFIWTDYFKKPLDDMGSILGDTYSEIRNYYFSCEWYEVYDFIEFIANNNLHLYNHKQLTMHEGKKRNKSRNEEFIKECNKILEMELSGYRFVDKKIIKITSELEIDEIENVLNNTSKFSNINQHIKQGIHLLANRKKPDYRNSIKESISAVEALCKIITKEDNATLGKALKIVGEKLDLHPALVKSFSNLYGYTSSADGIRHSLLEGSSLNFEDAKYFLVSCSAFINYLITKSSRLNIDFLN